MHFLHVKLLAQWLQVYSADGGATLSGQLDPPALSCPFTQPICELPSCLHQDYHAAAFSIKAALFSFLEQVYRPPCSKSVIPTLC